MRPRVLVVGCGGIGGVVLASLTDPDTDAGADRTPSRLV
jgi:saccharopine dehydrogenase-like NADP-dependent oxidoreductase